MTKACPICYKETTFHKNAWKCKDCANKASRANHARRKYDVDYIESRLRSRIKFNYGISLEEYRDRLAQQDYKCAICGVELTTNGQFTHYDHCHKTGKFRAFLCTNCNRGLGHFQESIENLNNAINYLNTHNMNVAHVELETIR